LIVAIMFVARRQSEVPGQCSERRLYPPWRHDLIPFGPKPKVIMMIFACKGTDFIALSQLRPCLSTLIREPLSLLGPGFARGFRR